MPMRYPRYTTFRDEELVAVARRLFPQDQTSLNARTLREQANGTTRPVGGTSNRTALIKEHYCAVTYPDGATGTCRYVRIGPAWHLFHYRHSTQTVIKIEDSNISPAANKSEADRFLIGIPLPTQYFGQRMSNTLDAIEAKAREFAEAAFQEAILHEQKDRFRRATPPGGKKPDPASFQFPAKRAKEIGGKYALCRPLGEKLLPDSPLFDTLEPANAAWEERNDPHLLVACACRWTRRWEMPRFNPLYRDYPHPTQHLTVAG